MVHCDLGLSNVPTTKNAEPAILSCNIRGENIGHPYGKRVNRGHRFFGSAGAMHGMEIEDDNAVGTVHVLQKVSRYAVIREENSTPSKGKQRVAHRGVISVVLIVPYLQTENIDAVASINRLELEGVVFNNHKGAVAIL